MDAVVSFLVASWCCKNSLLLSVRPRLDMLSTRLHVLGLPSGREPRRLEIVAESVSESHDGSIS